MIPPTLLAALLATAAPEASLVPTTVPAVIQVPAGVRLARKLHATGAQVYVCVSPPASPTASPTASSPASPPASPTGSATFVWTLKRPDARLFDATGAPAGTHGAGPTWTAKDGSAVIGEKIAQADAPVAGAVPWLLLRAKSTSGRGTFAAVKYVQRLDTEGGKAPATGCDAKSAGTELRVDYSANYYFFENAPASK